MDNSVKEFYISTEKNINYINNYENEHGGRLDFIVNIFNLKQLENQKFIDVGGGLGFLGRRLNQNNKYLIIDGADIPKENIINNFEIFKADIETSSWSENLPQEYLPADVSFCLETIEHLSNPYNCLLVMKKITKIDGEIYLSIPHSSVTHNTIYPALIYPPENFVQFLNQMALPLIDYKLFENGWKTHIFKCKNLDWQYSQMLFPKQEQKFIGKTPLEYTNI